VTVPDTAGASVAECATRLAARAGEVALCLDFDGTLSPIVPDPASARPLEGVVELLGPLAERFAALALVSGRPAVADLLGAAAGPGGRPPPPAGRQTVPLGDLAGGLTDRPGTAGRSSQTSLPGTTSPATRATPSARSWPPAAARSVLVAGDDLGDLAAGRARKRRLPGGQALRRGRPHPPGRRPGPLGRLGQVVGRAARDQGQGPSPYMPR
jgi:hypothetical protein